MGTDKTVHDAMISQTKPVPPQATLLRFSDALRQGLSDFFVPTFLKFLDQLPSNIMLLCQSVPDHQQQPYLDIILELRRHRDQIEPRIAGVLEAQLHRFNQLAQKKDNKTAGLNFQEISLVDSSEMEVSVALETAGSRLSAVLEPTLGESFSRLQLLASGLTEHSQLPYHGRALLQAMLECLSVIMLSAVQKVALVRLFSKELALAKLTPLIQDALYQAQIPELDKTIRNAEDSGKKPEPKPDLADVLRDIRDQGRAGGGGNGALSANGTLESVVDEKGIAVLQRAPGGGLVVEPEALMRQAAQFAQISPSVAAAAISPEATNPMAVEEVVATNTLMALLTRLQDVQPRTHVDMDPTAPSVAEVRHSIRQQLHSDDERVERIGKQDTDIINLVSMMFDFILDDDDLPTAMKALLGRLQIPMLKVAILDGNFFRTEDHPARRLLNSLAKAGVGWDEQAKSSDAMYKKLEETVFSILNDFEDDISLFDRLLEDFESFYSEQQTRVSAVDERTREAEENRARADMARTIVQQALNRRLNGRKLPFAVVRVLQEGWRHVLYLGCLKEGTESEAWRQAVKVVDALIWSVMPPKGDAQWVERLKNVSPKLMNSLRKGLVSVHFDTLQMETLLREIGGVHKEIIEGFETAMVEIVDQEAANANPEFNGLSVDQALRATHPNLKAVVLPKAETHPIYEGETLPASDRHLVAAKQMTIGSWVEFMHSDRRDRHKLVARIRTTERLIFANRRGIKVAEMSQMQLAVEFSQGRARIVEEKPQIIDRALQSVVGGLRQLSV